MSHSQSLSKYVWLVIFYVIYGSLVVPVNAQQKATVDPVAERMLLLQREIGGWPQPGGDPVDYNKPLMNTQQQTLRQEKKKLDATIDDQATTGEIKYLVQAFKQTRNPLYVQAAEQGIRYLLKAQYSSGGWGQFYPDTSSYHKHITYNDQAMIDVMWVMRYITDGTQGFEAVDKTLVSQARRAMHSGIRCILNTQYRQNGKLTAWCAQHDRNTLLPANARTFELASLSGNESVGIIRFLMSLNQPSPAVKQAVHAAVAWLESVKLSSIALKRITDSSQPKGRDVLVVPDSASTLWARFYTLDSNKPFFCGRDGIKKQALAEIENERRVGYAWYGTWPAQLLTKEYPDWVKKWGR